MSALVKTCGMFREQDIDAVNAALPDFCGFIVNFPRSHRNVSEEQLVALRARLHPDIAAVGVFVDQPVADVARVAKAAKLDFVQLHGRESEAYIQKLRRHLQGETLGAIQDDIRNKPQSDTWDTPFDDNHDERQDASPNSSCCKMHDSPRNKSLGEANTRIIKAFKVRTTGDVAAAQASTADWILLDNGQGTGSTFDWTLLQGIDRPYFLAGGLTPENIGQAVETLHPYAVDLSSGLETNGLKDPVKIAAAVRAARGS